ncbi:MAG: ATP-dependent DNA ligase, partial [Anaerolineae bacterium]
IDIGLLGTDGHCKEEGRLVLGALAVPSAARESGMSNTPFGHLAALGERLEQTSKRSELIELLAGFLQKLAPDEIGPGVRMVIGQVFPGWDTRILNMSWRAVAKVVDQLTEPDETQRKAIVAEAVDGGQGVQLLLERARLVPPEQPPLTILEVYRTFEEMAEAVGAGSRRRKEQLLRSLLVRATPVEAKYLVKNVLAEMRHGVGEGILLEAIAKAAKVPPEGVRRGNMLWGDIGEVARAALVEGREGIEAASIRLFHPLKPMLAQTADDLSEAFRRHQGGLALEYKLDGARVQIHKRGEEVRIYSRRLSDVTRSLPDLVQLVRDGLRGDEAVVEGEAVAVDGRGRPLPFQYLMRRFRRVRDVAAMVERIPLELYLFDLLYLDGYSFIDTPYKERWLALVEAAGSLKLVQRLLPRTVTEGETFAEEAYRAGHEGVIAKQLSSTYTPGLRGKAWLKLKHILSLDLVVVAADWGYGRRHGWLSNYHLAARDEASGDFLVVGKTFKGLTDDQFQEMTEKLLALEVTRRRSTVFVEPWVVVEVLFNEIQASPQYKSGYALRFARIARIREDKSVNQADTIQTVRQLYDKQFEFKGQGPEK